MGGRLTASSMAVPLRSACWAVWKSAASPLVDPSSASETVSAMAGKRHPPCAVLTRDTSRLCGFNHAHASACLQDGEAGQACRFDWRTGTI